MKRIVSVYELILLWTIPVAIILIPLIIIIGRNESITDSETRLISVNINSVDINKRSFQL